MFSLFVPQYVRCTRTQIRKPIGDIHSINFLFYDFDTRLPYTNEELYDIILYMSRLMRKPTICICENKDADQLRGNREADQCLCFRYTDSTVPLLLKSEISSLQPSSVLVQPALYQTCSETTLLVFPRGGSYLNIKHNKLPPMFDRSNAISLFKLV